MFINFVAISSDSIPSNDPDIEFRRADYEMYFSNLASSGYTCDSTTGTNGALMSCLFSIGVAKRNELQLMWDFQTASQECITERQ